MSTPVSRELLDLDRLARGVERIADVVEAQDTRRAIRALASLVDRLKEEGVTTRQRPRRRMIDSWIRRGGGGFLRFPLSWLPSPGAPRRLARRPRPPRGEERMEKTVPRYMEAILAHLQVNPSAGGRGGHIEVRTTTVPGGRAPARDSGRASGRRAPWPNEVVMSCGLRGEGHLRLQAASRCDRCGSQTCFGRDPLKQKLESESA